MDKIKVGTRFVHDTHRLMNSAIVHVVLASHNQPLKPPYGLFKWDYLRVTTVSIDSPAKQNSALKPSSEQ